MGMGFNANLFFAAWARFADREFKFPL
jgi:hypothetical protein